MRIAPNEYGLIRKYIGLGEGGASGSPEAAVRSKRETREQRPSNDKNKSRGKVLRLTRSKAGSLRMTGSGTLGLSGE
jgi:hypothetical protein